MKIEGKIEKYLDEKASREEAKEKLKKVIKSAKTPEQMETAVKMARNYYKMYGEKGLVKLFGIKSGPEMHSLLNMIRKRKKEIDHELLVKNMQKNI